jgi:hypothetical protein
VTTGSRQSKMPAAIKTRKAARRRCIIDPYRR